MIAEALEAAWLVASALAAWIVAGVVAVTVGLYAVVVAGWGIWRVVSAAYAAAGLRSDSLPPLTASQGSGDQIPARLANHPSGPP
ncbi:hypothetical protein OG235_27830 [Streptomyces sp. NBC_00024]|uniref:hypothetical protein n=1 Tax=Streptomyces sp. NBC_00024 TaxID=2903612 RepID=UPI00324B10F7